jgi:ERCC4-type nuclease
MPVQVTIDTREEDLWALMEPWTQEGAEWKAERAALDVGDVRISVQEGEEWKEVVVLERKAAEDLGSSQRDGRYREQRARLLAKRGAGVLIGYVVEVPPWSPTLTRTWCQGRFTEVHLQTAITRLQLRYGIPVFQAQGPKETLQWIRRIVAQLCEDPTVFQTGILQDASHVAAAYTEAIHVKKAANMDAGRTLATVLRTLPGVGITAADAIVRHTKGSFSAFYALSEEELTSLEVGEKRKLGKALASRLWCFFHSTEENEVHEKKEEFLEKPKSKAKKKDKTCLIEGGSSG